MENILSKIQQTYYHKVLPKITQIVEPYIAKISGTSRPALNVEYKVLEDSSPFAKPTPPPISGALPLNIPNATNIMDVYRRVYELFCLVPPENQDIFSVVAKHLDDTLKKVSKELPNSQGILENYAKLFAIMENTLSNIVIHKEAQFTPSIQQQFIKSVKSLEDAVDKMMKAKEKEEISLSNPIPRNIPLSPTRVLENTEKYLTELEAQLAYTERQSSFDSRFDRIRSIMEGSSDFELPSYQSLETVHLSDKVENIMKVTTPPYVPFVDVAIEDSYITTPSPFAFNPIEVTPKEEISVAVDEKKESVQQLANTLAAINPIQQLVNTCVVIQPKHPLANHSSVTPKVKQKYFQK